jgi:hypothetical protein
MYQLDATEKNRHRPWLAYALEESLERALLAPRDVIDHANPEVLVTQLPPPVISELLSRALTMGTFSPAQVLESAPPALLAEHLDPAVMWRCLKEAADRGALTRKGAIRSAPARQWFASVLGRALETGLIAPADVLRHLPPSEFVGETPRPVMAELIKAALGRSSFDASLVLEYLTPAVIADNLETCLVWDCISEAAGRHFDLAPSAVKIDEPSPVKTTLAAAPATVSAAVKPISKPMDKDRPSLERRATLSPEKAERAAAIAAGTVSSAIRPSSSTATAVRTETGSARAPAPIAAAPPAADPARNDAIEWSPADDLDVLEDQPLPFPLPR